jgi:RNA polymerase sigma-70 factor (ECF subfamily)
VSTWLYRITTNQCVDEIRRRAARHALQEAAAGAGAEAAAPRPGPAPGRDLDVTRALQKVPREARMLLTLRYAEGLSYRELARVRGISVNTVKSQIARGKSILRAALRGPTSQGAARGEKTKNPGGSR